MDRENKVKKDMAAVIFIFTVFSIIAAIISLNKNLETDNNGRSYIERNNYGQGRKNVEIEARFEDDKEKYNVMLEEIQYSQEEIEGVFDKASKDLEELVLLENKSVDNIKTDLNFITKIPDTSIKVTWQVEENHIIDYSGHVDMSKAEEGSNPVLLKAVLTYGSYEAEHMFYVNVVKDKLTSLQKKKEGLRNDIDNREETTRQNRRLILPSHIDGEKVVWKYPKDSKAVGIFLLGIIIALGIYIEDRQKKKKERMRREQLMLSDYPDIISQLTLFINAGMATGNAWRKIVELYQIKKNDTGERPAYEEMTYTVNEMNQGLSEQECYREFGTRCDIAAYRKLGTMLASNLRKGNKNISELLKKESFNAFEERKNAARRKGEEASTKLLGPMFIMLAILLSIIVIPAFLSIQI